MKTSFAFVPALLAIALSGPALADEPATTAPMAQHYGLAFTVGGGVTGFTNQAMRDVAALGGDWEARIGVGTKTLVGFEGAYIGGIQNLDTLGLDANARLVSTALEGNARLNFLRTLDIPVQPYVLAGVGWKRFDVTNTSANTSSMANEDNVLEVPLGAGIGYREGHVLFDLRGVFRAAFEEDLMATSGTDQASLHSWDVGLKVGYEF